MKVLAVITDPQQVRRILRHLKRAAESELVAAPSEEPLPGDHRGRRRAETLTQRENEVLRLIADGYTNRQIGDLLGISIRTVETHRASISSKLGLRGRADLVRHARHRSPS